MRPLGRLLLGGTLSFSPRDLPESPKNDMFKQFPCIISVRDFSWKIKELVVIFLTDLQRLSVTGERPSMKKRSWDQT